jgi:hypothetical protein
MMVIGQIERRGNVQPLAFSFNVEAGLIEVRKLGFPHSRLDEIVSWAEAVEAFLKGRQESPLSYRLREQVLQYLTGAPIRQQLVVHQINGQRLDPFSILNQVCDLRGEVALTASSTPRTELDLNPMLSHFQLHLRKIEDLSGVGVTHSHIFKRGFAKVTLHYLMNNDSIRVGYLLQRMWLVARLSTGLFIRGLTQGARLVFERISRRRLVGVVAIGIEASFKIVDSLGERINLLLLLRDNGKEPLDEFNDSIRATIIYSFYLITIHHLMKASTLHYGSEFAFSASG